MNYRIRFKSLKYLWFVLFFLYSVSELWAQFNIPKEPEKIYPVNDYAQILSLEQRKALNKKLIIYNNSTSTEIILISIQNLNKEDPNLVAANWGGEWKIGQKRQDNGILVLLSVKDRRISIQNGRGIEPYFTDALSRRIIENEFIPLLKKGDYYGAFDKGTDAIFRVLKGTYKNTKSTTWDSEWNSLLFFILLLLISFLFSHGDNNKNGGIRSLIKSDLITSILLSGMMGKKNSRRSFDGDSGDFGGFGGGGDFGGGGASGKW